MTTTDQMTGDEFVLVKDALEANFRELTVAHDKAVSDSLVAWQAHRSAEPADEFQTLVKAQHLHRMADVLKAIMWARFPAGSLDWFGRED